MAKEKGQPEVAVLPIHFEDRGGTEFERLCFAYLLRAVARVVDLLVELRAWFDEFVASGDIKICSVVTSASRAQ